MNYLRLLGIVVLFVLVGLGTVGGCGSSGGGGGGEGCCVVGPDMCVDGTNKAECDLLFGDLDKGAMCSDLAICGMVPPPTQPPPTQPPPPMACMIPDLNTDFSDLLYLFIDPVTELGIAVTSDGELVVIVLVDLDLDTIGLGAIPIDAFACEVFEALVEGIFVGASGDCGKSDDSTLFAIFELIVIEVLFPDIIGECVAVEPIVVVTQRGEGESLESSALETARKAFLDMQKRGVIPEENEDGILLGDVLEQIQPPVE